MPKIRTDFVTNSSSSSYIIAYRNFPDFDEETLIKYPFLKYYGNLLQKILLCSGDDETTEGNVFKTKEEYENNIIERYGWTGRNTIESILENEDHLKVEYGEVLEYLEKEYNILEKEVSYHNDYLSCLFEQLAEDKDSFVIIKNDG